MRRSILHACIPAATLLVAATQPALAQVELVALDRVHRLYLDGQPRQAARALSGVAVEFRQEIGRCKDESIGARLIELEPRLDALAAQLGAGKVSGVSTLTAEFAVVDRLLAENHLQLAELGWSLRRFGNLDGVGRDLDLAARYVARAARWEGVTLDAAALSTLEQARSAAERLLQTPDRPPADTERAILALSGLIKAAR